MGELMDMDTYVGEPIAMDRCLGELMDIDT